MVYIMLGKWHHISAIHVIYILVQLKQFNTVSYNAICYYVVDNTLCLYGDNSRAGLVFSSLL